MLTRSKATEEVSELLFIFQVPVNPVAFIKLKLLHSFQDFADLFILPGILQKRMRNRN